jgi:type II secretory pathway predicted ATPase ExeA/uncharacterized protein YlaI
MNNKAKFIPKLIPTKSFVKASGMIHKVVKKNTMCAITGDAGIGKSTLRQIAIGKYAESKRYKVVHVHAGIIQSQDETGSIVSQMIRSLSPEQPKRNGLQQNAQLTKILQTVSDKYRIILSIDEAQELSRKTIYGLKKIHELGSSFQGGELFSIVLFGKPALVSHLEEYEVGYRIQNIEMLPMSEAEIKNLLKVNGITFKNENHIKNFHIETSGIPLKAINLIKQIYDTIKERKLDMDASFSYILAGDLNKKAKQFGISNNDISKYMYQQSKITVDKSTVQRANAGKLNGDRAKQIQAATQELIDAKNALKQNKV